MAGKVIRCIDLETTGVSALENAEPVEVALIDLDECGNELARFQTLVRPRGPISVEASAVHHILEADVLNAPAWNQVLWHIEVKYGEPDVWLAHHSVFEKQWLTADVTGGAPWICSWKSALRIWPEAPRHSNSVLRYWLGLNVETGPDMPAHRAASDCAVTAELFRRMLERASIPEMVAWETEPALMPRITFGRHRNKSWGEIPFDYLTWMLTANFDEDILFNVRKEIAARAIPQPVAL
jgi:exodeoxyribonuclease X